MNLYAEDCVKVNEDIYLIARSVNLIYRIDTQTGELEIIDSLYDAPANTIRASACILSFDNRLYFLPMNARWLSVLDLESKEWKTIEIDTIEGCYWDRFFCGTIHNNMLYMIGSKYPAIAVVNLSDGNVEIIGSEIYKGLNSLQEKLDDCYFRKDIVISNGILYAASCVSNQILIYDLNNNGISLCSIGENGMRFSGIAYDGKYFWISSRMTLEFYRWDPSTGRTEKYKIKDISEKKCYIGGVVFDGNNIILPGMGNTHTYFFDPFANDIYDSIYTIEKSFAFVRNYGDIDYCMTTDGVLELRRTDSFDIVIKSIDVNIDDSIVFEFVNKKDGVIQETETLSLEHFLREVIN